MRSYILVLSPKTRGDSRNHGLSLCGLLRIYVPGSPAILTKIPWTLRCEPDAKLMSASFKSTDDESSRLRSFCWDGCVRKEGSR